MGPLRGSSLVVELGGLAAVELNDTDPFGRSPVEGDDVVLGAAGQAVELVVVQVDEGSGGPLDFSPGQLGCSWGSGGDFCAVFGDPVLPPLLRLLVPLGVGPDHRGHVGGALLGDHIGRAVEFDQASPGLFGPCVLVSLAEPVEHHLGRLGGQLGGPVDAGLQLFVGDLGGGHGRPVEGFVGRFPPGPDVRLAGPGRAPSGSSSLPPTISW